jgi:hypothetical protein
MIDLYDSEILAAEKVLEVLNKKQKTHMQLEDFRIEAIERFQDVGLEVDVKCYDTKEPGVYAFDLEILGRLTKEEFDYEKMAHEVTTDILGVLPASEKDQCE